MFAGFQICLNNLNYIYLIPDYTTPRKQEEGKRRSGNVTLFTQKSKDVGPYVILDSESVIHEVIVPTCSYRMGVKEMAFGIAAIDLSEPDNGNIFYVNLWLPSRFSLLYAYIVAVSISLSLMLLGKVKRRSRRNSISTPKRRRSSTPSAHSYTKLV